MDGQDSDLPQFYAAQQQHHHRMLSNAGGGQHVSPSPLSGGMHHSVIRPMPNMSMSPTAILQSIGGAAGMPPPPQFHHHMDHPTTTASSPLSPSSSIMMQHGAAMGPGTTTAIASPPEPVKRKRGRPRKYGPDGAMNKMSSLSSSQHQQQHQMMGAPPRSATMGSLDMVGGMDVDAANKKRRGRPPGTGKKLSSPTKKPSGNAFSGSAGTSFTPHIITASPSEDVAGKIAAFATQSPRAVCVLSAMGSVSRVVLRHPADHASSVARAPPSYNNPAIYEGLYEILSLSGSYNLNEDQQNQSDGISVTLCSPERHVIGGVLGGALVAASTVQVVLGSFVHGGSRAKSKKAGKQPNFSSDSLGGGGTDASPSSGHNQNLTPPSVVTTTGGWPSSGIFDTRSSNIDINSSRG